ncbi:MAG: hypothetical protein JNL74_14380 [Fibrobacteres bacterium]|nr:hypothetical protein [Fibrobacterota bacterium]
MTPIYSILLLLVAVSSLIAQITFSSRPANMQFLARDKNDSAVVPVQGIVTAAGYDSISLTLYKSGSVVKRLSQKLAYNGSTAPFSLLPKVHAELVEYKIEVRLGNIVVVTADKIICGDAFMVDGQSNAAYSGRTFSSPWIRTFGLDSTWSNPGSTPWGIGRHIVENQKIPFFYINGSVAGTYIESHMRDTLLSSTYGKIYWRLTRSGLNSSVRAVLWYQGESFYVDTLYAGLFKELYNSWMVDYPGIEHVYTFQIHPGFCSNSGVMREIQRKMPSQLPKLSVLSTTNVEGHDGCHFFNNSNIGYEQMGDRMVRLIERDLYNSTDTAEIESPDIRDVFYSNDSHTQLTVKFNQAVFAQKDTVISDNTISLKDYFYFDGIPCAIDKIVSDTANHALIFNLKVPCNAKKLTYAPNAFYHAPLEELSYEGPWVVNRRNVGALTFHKYPIKEDSTYLKVFSRPSFIRRINFQVSANPWKTGWLSDNGALYSVIKGYGWGTASTYTRDDRKSENFLLNSFVLNSKPTTYTVDVPDGEYYLRIGMGDNSWGVSNYCWTAMKEDTLCRKIIGDRNTVTTNKVIVSGGAGLELMSYGAINYLVVCSVEGGMSMNFVADDGLVDVNYRDTINYTKSEFVSTRSSDAFEMAAFPNPFNPVCNVKYSLSVSGYTNLSVYDLSGRVIKTLKSGVVAAGKHEAVWDATDTKGNRVACGLYVYRLVSEGREMRLKVVLGK